MAEIKIPTQQEVESILTAAYDTAKSASTKASNSSVGQQISTSLNSYSKEIQDTIDIFLKDKGAVTQQQLNELDEKTRQTKLKMLEAESKNTMVKYGLYIAVAVLTFSVLWFLTREKK
jgi:hypothetical protein